MFVTRTLIRLAIIFTALAGSAHAYDAPKILNYDELMELSLADRGEYLSGLLDMLEEMEGSRSPTHSASHSPDFFRPGHGLISLLLPNAEALVGLPPQSVQCPRENYVARYTEKFGWRCYLRYEALPPGARTCPRGHELINYDCALPRTGWKDYVIHLPPKRTPSPSRPNNKGSLANPSRGERDPSEPVKPPGTILPKCPPNYLPRHVDGEPNCFLNDGQRRDNCPDGHENYSSSPEGGCILRDPKKAVPVDPKQDPHKCVPQTCNNDEAIETLKERAYPRDANGERETKCINGGVVNDFNFNRRVCPPVLKLEGIPGGPYTCPGGQTVCMPLVFGTDVNGKAFCVPSSHRTTRACDQKRSEAKNKGQWKDLMNSGLPGVREAWDKWAQDLTRLCVTNEATGVYHCRECEILSKYVSQLNQLRDQNRGGVCGRPNRHATRPAPGNKAPDGSNGTR